MADNEGLAPRSRWHAGTRGGLGSAGHPVRLPRAARSHFRAERTRFAALGAAGDPLSTAALGLLKGKHG
jgi:hypothetical protein